MIRTADFNSSTEHLTRYTAFLRSGVLNVIYIYIYIYIAQVHIYKHSTKTQMMAQTQRGTLSIPLTLYFIVKPIDIETTFYILNTLFQSCYESNE